MTKPKRQTEQHIIDSEGQKLLRERLPNHWVLREYRPDYGIDFALEVFSLPKEAGNTPTYETMGEHIFIQLKSAREIKKMPLRLYGRGNVEKQKENLNKNDLAGEIETARFQLDTSELTTVERMGVGVPVLLVIADLSASACYFVCLNDYIDKILIPRHENYRERISRVIHVPVSNEFGTPEPGQTALRWYAKRPKLYSAFQRFTYQAAEINSEWDSPHGPKMAKYFASRIAGYDFWNDVDMWRMIELCGNAIKRFLETGSPGLVQADKEKILYEFANGNEEHANEIKAQFTQSEIHELWRLLSVLPRNYEDVCREWFLPTALGYVASYF